MLTLSGKIPDLLQMCSPVAKLVQAGGVIVDVGPKGRVLTYWPETREPMEWVNPSEVFLDLTNSTGRAHAAWRLGAHHSISHRPDWIRKLGGWELWSYGGGMWYQDFEGPLADLDPNDPRLLPDGTRWVDAMALKLVCEHEMGALLMAESPRLAHSYLDAAGERDSLAEEVSRLRYERSRLLAWLSKIEGGDNPCDDEFRLRHWAWKAGMGQEVEDE